MSTLAARYSMSFAAVQKHVAVLERAEIVTKQRRGREQLVQANIDAVRDLTNVLNRFEEIWLGRINRMDDLLTGNPDRKEPGNDRHER